MVRGPTDESDEHERDQAHLDVVRSLPRHASATHMSVRKDSNENKKRTTWSKTIVFLGFLFCVAVSQVC